MKTNYATDKYQTEQKKRVMRDRSIKELQKELSISQEFNSALTTENLELGKRLKDYEERYNKECYNVVVNNEYVTEIIKLPAYRDYLPLQEIEGYDMNVIIEQMKTPLYKIFPFIYIDNRQMKVDAKQLNKYKLGGIL